MKLTGKFVAVASFLSYAVFCDCFTNVTSVESASFRRIQDETDSPQQHLGFNERNKSSQRVVILPGPHKTGSSSIQCNLSRWTRENILAGWQWPTLDGENKKGKNYWRVALQMYLGKKQERKEAYESLFEDAWRKGDNIVFGSETFDMVCQDSLGADRLMNGLLNMMPWVRNPMLHGSNEDITVVVSYRSPRVEHLISVWHQVGGRGNPLSNFILELPSYNRQWHSSLNPLGVAEKFVEKGLETVLLDLSGIKLSGLDVSEVVACEIMEPSACQNNRLLWKENAEPTIKNAKEDRGPMDLDSETLRLVDEVLVRLDSSYCDLVWKENFKVLHARDAFSWCGAGNGRASAINSHQAVALIKQIVRDAAL